MIINGKLASDYSNKELIQLFDYYHFRDTYILELSSELCIRAGLEDELLSSDVDTFEGLVDRAYDIIKEDLNAEH